MTRLENSFDRIQKSGAEIARIIDEIAFQTKLLALHAARDTHDKIDEAV